jgi:signal transduction histidine kinase
MNRIKLLPEIVANQIAAGEVVNAPSNVVKEMMENSIDAGAKCVKVNFRNGGKELIQIIDDGVGFDTSQSTDEKSSGQHYGIQNVCTRLQLLTGGTLDVMSIPDQGTTCEIRLPKAEKGYR